MSAGLQIMADSGNISLDSEMFNYSLISINDVACTYSRDKPSGFLTYSGIAPILVVYSPSGFVGLFEIIRNGDGSYTASFYTALSTFKAYVFDRVPQSSSGNIGFQTFNASGDLIFDSGRKYLNVRGQATASGITGQPTSNYGFAFTSLGVQFGGDVPNGLTNVLISCYRSRPDGVDISQSIVGVAPNYTQGLIIPPTVCLVDLGRL
ncbi:hypothetical protein [Dyella silvatica]|uniref:hypothetical protein n=1 Tax=Dyella silvatica TaxID=2992128 RepID=UPI00224E6741|nr:hypothetical protein [Dyella silvatica]